MSFERALGFVLEVEGGYVNNPSDSGGATNYGITQAVYNASRKGNRFLDVKFITNDEVNRIYQNNYWSGCHCEQMPDELATVVFDTAVNTGCQRAIKILQACLDIDADGIFGAETLNVIGDISDLKDFISKYLDERSRYYQRICDLNPDKNKFLKGWLNRIQNLREFIFT